MIGQTANYDGLDSTPAALLKFLEHELDEQVAAIKTPIDYFNGVHRLGHATAKWREAFSRYFPVVAAANWMKLIVLAPVSRLRVEGFRMNADHSTPRWAQQADTEAWDIWQASSLDAVSEMVHTEAVKCGVAYLLVSPPVDGGQPQITPEHPSQVYVHCDPANRRNRLAAIKRWRDEQTGYMFATIYTPDLLLRFRSAEKADDNRPVQWTRRVDNPVDVNPIGVVPMIPIENQTDMMYGGRSDLEVAIPIQDSINKLMVDAIISSEYSAFPQRYAIGWERATDEQGRELTGREVELASGQSRLWRAESTDTKFGQLTPGDVNQYLAPIELLVTHMGAVCRVPAYYLLGRLVNISADALTMVDAALVDSVRSKQLTMSDGWEEAVRTAFLAKGDRQRGLALSAETIWKDPQTRSMQSVTQSVVMWRQSLSMPLEMCWLELGMSPQQIQQAKQLMGLPDRTNAAAAMTPTPPIPAIPGVAAGMAAGAVMLGGQIPPTAAMSTAP